MPWKSVQQARWGHSPSGVKALGGKAKVSEWDNATPKGSLPAKVRKPATRTGKNISLRSLMRAK
jgi:hypothetical protein